MEHVCKPGRFLKVERAPDINALEQEFTWSIPGKRESVMA
jgi:hypothetical protein